MFMQPILYNYPDSTPDARIAERDKVSKSNRKRINWKADPRNLPSE